MPQSRGTARRYVSIASAGTTARIMAVGVHGKAAAQLGGEAVAVSAAGATKRQPPTTVDSSIAITTLMISVSELPHSFTM
jgi:hypothetical protein